MESRILWLTYNPEFYTKLRYHSVNHNVYNYNQDCKQISSTLQYKSIQSGILSVFWIVSFYILHTLWFKTHTNRFYQKIWIVGPIWRFPMGCHSTRETSFNTNRILLTLYTSNKRYITQFWLFFLSPKTRNLKFWQLLDSIFLTTIQQCWKPTIWQTCINLYIYTWSYTCLTMIQSHNLNRMDECKNRIIFQNNHEISQSWRFCKYKIATILLYNLEI